MESAADHFKGGGVHIGMRACLLRKPIGETEYSRNDLFSRSRKLHPVKLLQILDPSPKVPATPVHHASCLLDCVLNLECMLTDFAWSFFYDSEIC